MNDIPIELPMSMSVVQPLDFSGEQDVINKLQDIIRTVNERTGSSDDRLELIKDVHAQLKEARSRTVKWLNCDPGYSSALNKDTFLDFTMIELFGLFDHIPVGPDGLLLDIIYEAKEPFFPGFDTWNLSSVQDALDLLCKARESIQMEPKYTLNN